MIDFYLKTLGRGVQNFTAQIPVSKPERKNPGMFYFSAVFVVSIHNNIFCFRGCFLERIRNRFHILEKIRVI